MKESDLFVKATYGEKSMRPAPSNSRRGARHFVVVVERNVRSL
jgi:hypothetical protein